MSGMKGAIFSDVANTLIKDSRAYEYASWCAIPDNRFVGIYVKKQAVSWLEIADGKNLKYTYAENAGKKSHAY